MPVIGRRENKVPGKKQRSKIPTHGPRVPGFPVELLPRPQRGTVQAAAQAGTTPALLAETGAAESQIAHEGRGPAKDNFLHRETPCFSDSPVIVSRGPHE